MPILVKSEQPPAAVECVREVRVGIPFERRREVWDFYARVLRLRPWSPRHQIPGGWGAGDPRRGIYFQYQHDPHVEPLRRRVVLTVASLSWVEQRLTEEGWPYLRQSGLGYSDQCILVSDPVGHRIELRQSQPL
ncbi:MAG: hypothetical protein KKB50_01290 [Planctomycetes bacterium]|nr:hypothetical protein [Planctomycetota bacterium]